MSLPPLPPSLLIPLIILLYSLPLLLLSWLCYTLYKRDRQHLDMWAFQRDEDADAEGGGT